MVIAVGGCQWRLSVTVEADGGRWWPVWSGEADRGQGCSVLTI